MHLIDYSRKDRTTGGREGMFGRILDTKFRTHAPNYFFQCGLAMAFLIVILLVEDAVLRGALVVASASTAFTVFVFPDSVAAAPRRVIGGHVVAVVGGTLFALILAIPELDSTLQDLRYLQDIIEGVSVGLSIFLMVLTDTEHPPAAGTALAFVVQDWRWSSVVFIMGSALILSLIRLVLRPKLINLL